MPRSCSGLQSQHLQGTTAMVCICEVSSWIQNQGLSYKSSSLFQPVEISSDPNFISEAIFILLHFMSLAVLMGFQSIASSSFYKKC